MAECECLPKCPFFHDKMDKKPAMAEMYKKKYCLRNFKDCARHRVFSKLGKPAVPADLYPNQIDRALSILQQAKFSTTTTTA